jgi:hypothetical protein
MPAEYRLILKHADQPGYTPDIECYLRHAGYEALKRPWQSNREHFRTAGKSAAPSKSATRSRYRACVDVAGQVFPAG